jgi:hypothetical protein
VCAQLSQLVERVDQSPAASGTHPGVGSSVKIERARAQAQQRAQARAGAAGPDVPLAVTPEQVAVETDGQDEHNTEQGGQEPPTSTTSVPAEPVVNLTVTDEQRSSATDFEPTI